MAKKLYSLTIQGKDHVWGFDVLVDPQYVEEWRADGITIDEVCNVIPTWVVALGLLRVWCFFQDGFHFKNPFAGW